MGNSILTRIMQRLYDLNFRPGLAYPGQKVPRIEESMATVHLEKVDRSNLSVTVEVCILCPGSMGGTACELEALRATEALRWEGAECVQNGCTYDGVAQVYMVRILATFTGIAGEADFVSGPGFSVEIDGVWQPDAVAFTEEAQTGYALEYETGTAAPVGYTQGVQSWQICLEERIPAGSWEPGEPAGEFVLAVVTEEKTETFSGCRWTEVQRTRDVQGLKRVRRGLARMKEEE